MQVNYRVLKFNNRALQFNKRALYMSTIRERANSYAALCNWIRELFISIKKLSYIVNTPAIWKNVGIRELSNSIGELSNSIRDLVN